MLRTLKPELESVATEGHLIQNRTFYVSCVVFIYKKLILEVGAVVEI